MGAQSRPAGTAGLVRSASILRAGRRVRFRKLHRHLLSANGKTKRRENANRAIRLRRRVVFDESESANGSMMNTVGILVPRQVDIANDSIELKAFTKLLWSDRAREVARNDRLDACGSLRHKW